MTLPRIFRLIFTVTVVTNTMAFAASYENKLERKTAWGSIHSKGNLVTLKVSEQPEQGYVALPRLNNRLETVTVVGYEKEIRFVPEPDHWRVFMPKQLDYPATVQVKLIDELRLCENPFVVKQAADGSVTLPAHHAETIGEKLRFEPQPKKNTIGYWTVASDKAFWLFELNQLKELEIVVHQGCGKGQGGSEIELIFTSLGDASSQLHTLTIKDTGHFQNFVPRQVGKIKLAPAKYKLEVRCRSLAKKAVCDIRKIELLAK